MSKLIPKYLGFLKNRTNSQLLAWQLFNLLKYSSVIVIAILMARFVIDIQVIKSYEKLVLVGSSFSFFFISGLGQIIIPFFESEKVEDKQSVFKSLFLLLTVLASSVFVLISSYGYFFDSSHFNLYLLFSLATLFNIPSFTLESYYLANRNHLKLITWGIGSFLVQISFLILPILWYNQLSYGIWGYSIVCFFKFIITAQQINLKPTAQINKQQVKRIVEQASPIVLSFLIGNAYLYINAFIVENQLSEKDFVLYRYGAKEFPLFLIIANSFSLIYSGKISKASAENSITTELLEFKQKNKKVMHQLFPIAIALMLSSEVLFGAFYGKEFTEAHIVFNLLLLLLISRVLFPQTILYGLQKSKPFLYASSLELISGFTLSLILIKPYGLVGVCLAMIIAFLLEKIYLILICYREKIKFFNYFPTGLFLIYSSVLLAAAYVSLNLF